MTQSMAVRKTYKIGRRVQQMLVISTSLVAFPRGNREILVASLFTVDRE